MKTIYLLRHAKSSWDDPLLTDFDRPLNSRGRRACKAIRARLAELEAPPQMVLCSTALRAEETLQRILPAFSAAPPVGMERGLYLASARKLLARLHRLDDEIDTAMLLGHNPGLERLIGLLIGPAGSEAREPPEKFPTGALAVLKTAESRWRDVKGGGARLVELWTPRDAPGD